MTFWLAWAAGLFEGEGTATTCGGVPRLALRMSDFDVVQRFAAVVDAGTVYGPYDNAAMTRRDGHARKPHLLWVATGDAGAEVAELLKPWLGERRLAQIAAVYGSVAVAA